jgi:hypothetical protein
LSESEVSRKAFAEFEAVEESRLFLVAFGSQSLQMESPCKPDFEATAFALANKFDVATLLDRLPPTKPTGVVTMVMILPDYRKVG